MQKYIKNDLTNIYYFDENVDVTTWINLNEYRLMLEDEIDKHENPEKYLSDKERSQLARERMQNLSPIEFDVKLVDEGLFDQVQELIQSDIKLRIAYTRATFFSRTDPFIDQARIALGLTDEQVDEIWESSLV